jgi:hypothetical protein
MRSFDIVNKVNNVICQTGVDRILALLDFLKSSVDIF